MSDPGNGRYNGVAIAFHWTIAALIAVMFVLGWTMDSENPAPDAATPVNIHRTIGVVIMVLVVLRFLWRLGHRAPPFPVGMPRWEQTAAFCGHCLLYALTFAIPAAGLAMAVQEGEGSLFFGLIPFGDGAADIGAVDEEGDDGEGLFSALHFWLGWALLALLVAHIGAALAHGLVVGDNVLGRMLPGRG